MADMDRDQFHTELGGLIKRLRLNRGLSQENLGKAVGLTRTSVVNIEAGRQGIYAHTMVELLDVLGLGLVVIED